MMFITNEELKENVKIKLTTGRAREGINSNFELFLKVNHNFLSFKEHVLNIC